MSERATDFNALFDAHHVAILGYLARRTEQPADAADLLADVFMTAWRRLSQVPEGTEGRMWLFGVARNALRNHRRVKARHGLHVARVREQMLVAVSQDASVAADVRDALSRLRETDREVLTLTVWEDLQPAEIGMLLKLSPGAVRVRLHRARQRLGQILGDGSPAADPAGRDLNVQSSYP